jgi:hypothetical protein
MEKFVVTRHFVGYGNKQRLGETRYKCKYCDWSTSASKGKSFEEARQHYTERHPGQQPKVYSIDEPRI